MVESSKLKLFRDQVVLDTARDPIISGQGTVYFGYCQKSR